MTQGYEVTGFTGSLPTKLSEALRHRLETMRRDRVIERIWSGDYRVWKDDPSEITEPNRLGWLDVARQMRHEVEGLKAFAHEVRRAGFSDVVLLGMGGSSLAPEVLYSTFGGSASGLRLQVLDSTVPADVLAISRSIDINATLFIVASKSGGTLETMSQLAYFWDKKPNGESFVAITDPGSSLAALAEERGFRRCFLNPDSIGGRYSALSFFGLVPAALIGVDLDELLRQAIEMETACRQKEILSANPGANLGALIAEAAIGGYDKLTFALDNKMAGLGAWLEQLIAESTGKQGLGIIPIDGEALGAPSSYGADRVFVSLGRAAWNPDLDTSGAPVIRLAPDEDVLLGAEFFRWEFATAVAGYVLGINPFDQPNVQQAKDAAARFLRGAATLAESGASLQEVLDSIKTGDYVALQAYSPRSDRALHERLQAVRMRLRDRHKVATTLGYGPRYLHSTGQIHKGGANTGVFFQLVDDVAQDVAIPGQSYSFGRLMRAQADGDLDALRSAGRRAVRVSLAKLEEATR